MRITSMTPLKSASTPMGMVTGPRREPKRACSVAMAASKSAFSRSMWLMYTARDRRMLSASRHSLVVMTCGPATASTTKSNTRSSVGSERVAYEVGMARSVQEVDLEVLVGDGGEGGADGELALDLFGVVVQIRLPIVGGAHAGRLARDVEHGLGERGLAGPVLADKDDVAHVFGSGSCHVDHNFPVAWPCLLAASKARTTSSLNPTRTTS